MSKIINDIHLLSVRSDIATHFPRIAGAASGQGLLVRKAIAGGLQKIP
jgi:hypothetical protein